MNYEYYLRIINNNSFGFVVDGIHDIKETDKAIDLEDYNNFFKLQSEGSQFRLKEAPTGTSLFDYIEKYIPEVVVDTTPSTEDRIKALEMALLEVL